MIRSNRTKARHYRADGWQHAYGFCFRTEKAGIALSWSCSVDPIADMRKTVEKIMNDTGVRPCFEPVLNKENQEYLRRLVEISASKPKGRVI